MLDKQMCGGAPRVVQMVPIRDSAHAHTAIALGLLSAIVIQVFFANNVSCKCTAFCCMLANAPRVCLQSRKPHVGHVVVVVACELNRVF